MASPSLPPSSTASSSFRSPVEDPLIAINQLVNYGLSKTDIMILSKLGSAGMRGILDMLDHVGRSSVEMLLDSLDGISEESVSNLIEVRNTIANEKNERGRPPFINSPSSSIDNNFYASTATPRSTPYLRPPLPSHASLQRSTSTARSVRSASSKGSSSTNITHPSTQNKVTKTKPPSKPARRELYCPECEKKIKNGFDKHFRGHFDYLLGSSEADINVDDAIGCGYCHAQGVVLADEGKVFHGAEELVRHVKEVHASNPFRLHWEVNYAFNHILSAQDHFRRKILVLAERDGRETGHENAILSLSWVPADRPLLQELQVVSGQIDRNTHNDNAIDALLMQVYDAAAKKWQPLSAVLSVPPTSQHIVARRSSHPNATYHPPPELTQDFIGIGGGFDTPTPKHRSFENDIRSPSILSPSPQVSQAPQIPQHIQPMLQPSREVDMTDWDAPSYGHEHSVPEIPPQPPMIAFDGHAQYATPPPSQGMQFGLIQDICDDFHIDSNDLYHHPS